MGNLLQPLSSLGGTAVGGAVGSAAGPPGVMAGASLGQTLGSSLAGALKPPGTQLPSPSMQPSPLPGVRSQILPPTPLGTTSQAPQDASFSDLLKLITQMRG